MEREKRRNNIVLIHGIEIHSEKQEEQVEQIKFLMKDNIRI